jgi:hypothetical protein
MIQRIGRGCGLAALVLLLVSAQTPQPQPVDGTPLLRAKLALEMARARVLEDRFADAAASLRDASKALADYAKDSPGPHAETALFIRGELDSYAAQMSATTPTPSIASISGGSRSSNGTAPSVRQRASSSFG